MNKYMWSSMWVWAFSWLLGSVYHPQSACRSPWCWKIQRKAAGSDLLQYHTLQSLNWKQVQWGNCTGVFWQKIHWIGLSCRGCTDKTNTVGMSTPQPQEYSRKENLLHSSHADKISLILPGSQQEAQAKWTLIATTAARTRQLRGKS